MPLKRARRTAHLVASTATNLHAVTRRQGPPPAAALYAPPRQVSDYTGAGALLGNLSSAEWVIADRGYGPDWLGEH